MALSSVLAGLILARVSRRDVSAPVTPAQSPVWTFLEFEADGDVAGPLADALAGALLADGGWYAEFGGRSRPCGRGRWQAFRYRRGDQHGRAQAMDYGRAMGVPEDQMDWPD